jgi:hypothetical protein
MPLRVDPASVRIIGNEAASAQLRGSYRPPFVVPETL